MMKKNYWPQEKIVRIAVLSNFRGNYRPHRESIQERTIKHSNKQNWAQLDYSVFIALEAFLICYRPTTKEKLNMYGATEDALYIEGTTLIINVNDLRAFCLSKRQAREDLQHA